MTTTNDDLNEDWIKTLSWDLGSWDDFISYLGASGLGVNAQIGKLREFMKLPAWEAAPASIRNQAEALIARR